MGKKNPSSRDEKESLLTRSLASLRLVDVFGSREPSGSMPREPAAPPGIEHLEAVNTAPSIGQVSISVIDFSEMEREERSFDSVDDLVGSARPDWATTRWIDVQGIHPYVIMRLQERYGLHPLAVEDALHLPQRPKIEDYDDSLFVILKMLRVAGERLQNEQVCFFLLEDTLITIQEQSGDVWDRVRQRTHKHASRMRKYGAPYMLYALVDALVDHVFPVLDRYFEQIDSLEEEILSSSDSSPQGRIHSLKRELIYLRQAIWPMRNVVASLAKNELEWLPEEVKNYFRDVSDHVFQAAESLEICQETVKGLQDLHISMSGNRMNEVMKALTIMASLFLPLSFVAGVYGMNFKILPELDWKYGYAMFWFICIGSSCGLLYYFRKKGWIGK